MRFMIIIKASQDSEAGKMPSQALLTAMGNYNEALLNAGILLAGEGLHPSSKGARVRFRGGHAHSHRRAVCRDQGADCRVLVVAGEVQRGGG